MLQFRPKIINTQDPEIRKAVKGESFKGHSIVNLLSKIWDLKESISSKKVVEVFVKCEEILRGLKEEERRIVVLRILKYLSDNTKLDTRTWDKSERELIEKGILNKGGDSMKDVLEITEEQGRWRGRQEGRQEGLMAGRQEGLMAGRQEGLMAGRQERNQQIILNMLKEQFDIAAISKVTGLSEKEIKKLKNGA